MAQLTLNVNDAIIPRLRAAYGVTTNAQLKAAIIEQIRGTVKGYEVHQTIVTEKAKIATAETNMQTAVQTIEANADSQIVLT